MESFESLLRRLYLLRRLENGHAVGDDEVFVTEVVHASLCPRYAWFERHAPTTHLNEHILRGVAVHEFVAALFSQIDGAEKSVSAEINGVRVRGRVDVAHNGVIYEVKTVSRLPDAPYGHHVLQAQLYSFITGSPCRLVYIDGEFKIQEFEVPPPDPKEVESAVAHAAAVLRTPDPPEGRESWLCKYCTYPCKLRGGEG